MFTKNNFVFIFLIFFFITFLNHYLSKNLKINILNIKIFLKKDIFQYQKNKVFFNYSKYKIYNFYNIKNIDKIIKNSQLKNIDQDLYYVLKQNQPIYLFFNKTNIKNLIWQTSILDQRIYNNFCNSLQFFKINLKKKINNKILFSILSKNNIIDASYKIGINKKDILYILKLLTWKINFNDLNKYDKFAILHYYHFKNNLRNKSEIVVHIKTKNINLYFFKLRKINIYKNICTLSNHFMYLPIKKNYYKVSSKFNLNRIHPIKRYIIPHKGVDLALPIGTPIFVVGDGKVLMAKKSFKAGNYISIKHNNNCITKYMHLKKILVKKNQIIKMGQVIALSGNTGYSTGPHLHYELWINSKAVNPLNQRTINNQIIDIQIKNYSSKIYKLIKKLKFI